MAGLSGGHWRTTLEMQQARPKGTRVLISLWDSLMFGRVPGTRPSISESHSETSTRVPFCIAGHDHATPRTRVAQHDDEPGTRRHAFDALEDGGAVQQVAWDAQYKGGSRLLMMKIQIIHVC